MTLSLIFISGYYAINIILEYQKQEIVQAISKHQAEDNIKIQNLENKQCQKKTTTTEQQYAVETELGVHIIS